MEVIVIIIAIYLAYLLIRYVIIPMSGVLGVIAIVAGVGYALYVSLASFGKSIKENINPYITYDDKNMTFYKGVRRNYFFGPGFHQIKMIVSEAFGNLKNKTDSLTKWRNDVVRYRAWYLSMWIWIFYIIAFLCAFFIGFIFVSLFSIILFSVIFSGMCVFYIFFSLFWLIDRYILLIESIHSRCADCKRISVVPNFICPNCGTEHKKLSPGPYGIFIRKCRCGEKLPTAFITRRSKLKANCPYCSVELASSDARQFGIQLVGGISSGKSAFLSAFLHLYQEKLKSVKNMSHEIFPENDFIEMEYWYQQGLSTSTNEKNANMYCIIHKKRRKTFQLSLYDIAGEAFNELRGEKQQQQFRYCEGIIFVIDPSSKPDIANDAISNFITEFKSLRGKHTEKISNIPIAVLISKADLFQNELSLDKIKTYVNEVNTFEQTRNRISKEFLENHNFGNTLNIIEGNYNYIQYFPISAIGHMASKGQSYKPWGVMEPVFWLLFPGNKEKYFDNKLNNNIFSWIYNPVSIPKKILKNTLYAIGISILASIIICAAFGIFNIMHKQKENKIIAWNESFQSPTYILRNKLNISNESVGDEKNNHYSKYTRVKIIENMENSSLAKISYGDERIAYINKNHLYRPGLYVGELYKGNKSLWSSYKWIKRNVINGTNYTIILGENQTVNSIDLNFNNLNIDITLIGIGTSERNVYYKNEQPTSSLITIGQGINFYMEDGVQLIGKQNNTRRLITVDGGTFIMNGGSIRNNKASSNGGGVDIQKGKFIMNYGTIIGNNSANGAGVYIKDGIFTMNNGAIIDNTAYGSGGGVIIYKGTFTMNGGSIEMNTASNKESGYGGGGVSVNEGSNFIMNNGNILRNTANHVGGGVFIKEGYFMMNNGNINENKANYSGGGVYLNKNKFNMNDGIISENSANDAENSNSGGGGVFIGSGEFILNKGIISKNTSVSDGGGITMTDGEFIMNDGIIIGNTAKADGGGISVIGGNFTMNNGSIRKNIATRGGGLWVSVKSVFIKSEKGGVIYGSNAGADDANKASRSGHAVHNGQDGGKRRNTTVWATQSMDTRKRGAAGGWQ